MSIIESVQQYDLNIPPGGSQNIDVQGDRVQFISALDPFAQIELRPNFAQGNISLKPGQGFRFSQPVQRWVVFNRGTVPLSGYLLIGSGDFFDQRISGDVNVIDNGRSRTLANLAFSGASGCSAVVGQYAHFQIWNPAGSGKKLVVSSALVTPGSASGVGLLWSSAPLSTASGQVFPSKLSGGAASVAQARNQTAGSLIGDGSAYIWFANINSATPIDVIWKEPAVILPGAGLVLAANTANVTINGVFEFTEEAA